MNNWYRACTATVLAFAVSACASVATRGVGSFADGGNGYPVSIERGGIFYNYSPITIYVNGEEAAVLAGRTTITIHVPEGRHIIAASPKNKSMRTEIVVDVSQDFHPILRTNLQFGGPRLEVINR